MASGMGELFGRVVQSAIYRAGAFGHLPEVPVHPVELQRAARRVMSRRAWSYVHGSAGLEETARANRVAFRRWQIVPRMLTDVSGCDTSVELFGRRLPSPFLLAPIGVLEMAHEDAELAVAGAARELDLPMVISTQASVPMEETAAALGECDRWYQLYWSSDDQLVDSFVRRAEAIGSTAVVVTLDTQLLGWRTRDLDLAWLPFIRNQGIAQYTSDARFQAMVAERAAQRDDADQPRPTLEAVRTLLAQARAHPGGVVDNLRSPLPRTAAETFVDVFARTDLTWDDLAWLRGRTDLPIVLKGIQSAHDARQALEHGIDGIVVSNHGGRQVDGAIGSLDALPSVVAEVGGAIPVLFDSGIRGGADAFKAIALGATAVLVGRPYVYGLALAGQRGVYEVMRNLLADFSLTMALSGCASVADVTADRLVRADEPPT